MSFVPGTKEKPITGGLTVGDLLRQTSWGLELITGEGGLDRLVRWAHPSEVALVLDYLDGGELVMSVGSLLPAEPEAQVALIRGLHRNGASALSLGTKAPPLSEELISEANLLNFPIVKAPVELGYMTVTKYVASANVDETQQRLLAELRIYETLAPGQMLAPRQKFTFIEKLIGYNLFVVNVEGKSLLTGMEDVPSHVSRESLKLAETTQNSFSVTIDDGLIRPLTVLGRRAGYLVALRTAADSKSTKALSSLRHVEVIAGLEIADLYRRREIRRREGSELLGRFINGTEFTDRAAFTSKKGANRDFVLAGIQGPSTGEANLAEELGHRLSDRNVPHLLLEEIGRTLLVVPAGTEAAVAEVLLGSDITVGLSGPHSMLSSASIARREALWAESFGERDAAHPHLRHFGSAGEWAQWLPSDLSALSVLVDQVLGAVLAYDQKVRGSDLMHSLRIFLQNDGRLQTTADELHVHKNTLTYRLKRIETLSRRDLNSTADRAQIWLALQAAHIVADRREPGWSPTGARNMDFPHATAEESRANAGSAAHSAN